LTITIEKDPTSANETFHKENTSISVFPNYFDKQFKVKSDKAIQTISVYNQLGIKIKTVSPNASQTLISLDGFPAGAYLVKADQQAAVKVIKR
jgi:hypothetical protein